jgi:hypothetical protein
LDRSSSPYTATCGANWKYRLRTVTTFSPSGIVPFHPTARWNRPDGVGNLFIEQAVQRQIDDDLAPVRERLAAYVDAQAATVPGQTPVPDRNLPEDLDAAIVDAEAQLAALEAKRAALFEPPQEVLELLGIAVAAGEAANAGPTLAQV